MTMTSNVLNTQLDLYPDKVASGAAYADFSKIYKAIKSLETAINSQSTSFSSLADLLKEVVLPAVGSLSAVSNDYYSLSKMSKLILTAGEDISSGWVVGFVRSGDSVVVKRAYASGYTIPVNAVAISISNAAKGEPVTVQMYGLLSGFSGLTPGRWLIYRMQTKTFTDDIPTVQPDSELLFRIIGEIKTPTTVLIKPFLR